jgi:C4-dicarboxylate-specific signal transduction histidine kinase
LLDALVACWSLDVREARRLSALAAMPKFEPDPGDVDHLLGTIRIVDATAEATRLMGATSCDDLIGRTLLPMILVVCRPSVARPVWAAMHGQISAPAHGCLIEVNGIPFGVRFMAGPFPDDPDRIYLAATADQLPDPALEELKNSEERYRRLFQQMPIALWRINDTGTLAILKEARARGVTDFRLYLDSNPDVLERALDTITITEVNEKAVSLLGGKSAGEFIRPVRAYWQDAPDMFRRILTARYEGHGQLIVETRVRTSDGRTVDVLVSIAFPPLLSRQGMSVVGILDISDRLHAEEQLRSVQSEFAHASRVSTLGELATSIAHEIIQPLAAIVTTGEASIRWLSRPTPEIEKSKGLTLRMVSEAHRANDIIRRIHSMAVKKDVQRVGVDLNEVARNAVLFLGYDIQVRDIDIQLDLADDLPLTVGDPVQFQQVVINLIQNSVHALAQVATRERVVCIATWAADDGHICMSVQDSGPGIPAENLTKLFDSFFTTKEDGMGIGLTISQSIVTAHRGTINAHCPAEGGARFDITLPPWRSVEHEA